MRVGRDPANEVVLEGPEAATVSTRHMEIRKEGESYRLFDLNSTNGTYLDGKKVSEALLSPHAVIMLGPQGPQFQFEVETQSAEDLRKTVPVSSQSAAAETSVGKASIIISPPGTSFDKGQEDLLEDAVKRARQARKGTVGGQTVTIMREMLDKAIHRSSKKFKIINGALAVALIAVTLYAGITISKLKAQKGTIDNQINQIESQLQTAGNDPKRMEALIQELNQYQDQALEMQKNLLYRLGVRNAEQDFIESEIKQLMAEFGAEEYSIPPEFVEQARRFVQQYQDRDRAHMVRALGRSRNDLEAARRQLQTDTLPPDLVYIVLVESAFIAGNSSTAGAAGLWQFTAATAKAYGLRVTEGLDERLDPRKSTQAAARYIRELILDFGSGSSVMLALAAYNLGPGKVKRAVRTVEDPIKQRNFWYLYRIRALPAETREYVPKIIAAIIIGRNPARFGF
jgi:soluble lytic murein transglycosylase-like protein